MIAEDTGRFGPCGRGGDLVRIGLFRTATVEAMTQTPASAPKPGPPSARSALGGWLEGPRIDAADGDDTGYRGQRLGLPESGPGSLAPQGRRLGALVVDWIAAELIAAAFGWHAGTAAGIWGTLAIFAAEQLLLLSTLGYTIGKRLFGLRVGRLGGPLTPLNVAMRTLLLLPVIPAVVWDRDGRGLHDRLAGTVVVLR